MLYNPGLQTEEILYFLKHQLSLQIILLSKEKSKYQTYRKTILSMFFELLNMAWTSSRPPGLKDRTTEMKLFYLFSPHLITYQHWGDKGKFMEGGSGAELCAG